MEPIREIIPIPFENEEAPKTSVLQARGALHPDRSRRPFIFGRVIKAVGLNYFHRFGRNITGPSQ